MPIALRSRSDATPALVPLAALRVRPEFRPSIMAALQGRSEGEMQRRFDDGHRAYVAWYDGVPAAWGWIATVRASIGELQSSFVLSPRDRYLWNFVTLAPYRGKGIYPRLLEAIVRAESAHADRFWIIYAPENHASGAGIARAGFITVADLSFDANGNPAVRALSPAGTSAAKLLGMPLDARNLSSCWKCVRAGRGAMSCPDGACRCDYQRPEIRCAS